MNNAFIICRAKRRGNSSWVLEQALREQGIESYRVTPHRVPLRSRGWSPVYINYGCSQTPVWWDTVPLMLKMYNTFHTVHCSANKLRMQRELGGANVPILVSTRNREVAENWVEEGSGVVCRTLVASHSGRGIVLAHSVDELVEAPMYTVLYEGHRVREYRVFVVDFNAVDVVEKRRRGRRWCRENNVDRDSEYSNVIRSWRNGWVFARNTLEANESELHQIKSLAEEAASAINMGLGAVDIIVRRDEDTGELSDLRVVETNTSIGIDLGATSTNLLAAALANSIKEVA